MAVSVEVLHHVHGGLVWTIVAQLKEGEKTEQNRTEQSRAEQHSGWVCGWMGGFGWMGR